MGSASRLRTVLVAGVLAAAALASTTGGVSAYGKADQPLAQIEVSANCDNPGFPLCAPPPNGFGLGGIWVWTEIDTGWTADFAGAGCGHTQGGFTPGVTGGDGLHGEATWVYSTGVPNGAFAFATDPGNTYYVVTYDVHDVFAYPVTQGHYWFRPAPGVSIQLQVAP